RLDRAGLARWDHPHRIARLHGAAGDLAGKAAEVEVGAVDPLHRQTEWPGLRCHAFDLDRLEMIDQARAGVPGGVRRRRRGDVVALEAADRYRSAIRDSDTARKLAVIVNY